MVVVDLFEQKDLECSSTSGRSAAEPRPAASLSPPIVSYFPRLSPPRVLPLVPPYWPAIFHRNVINAKQTYVNIE